MISILTATYNRETNLPDLYNSLVKNLETKVEFEWLIMDDGSTDNTKELIDGYIKENKVNIRYFYQENKGKMAAINNLMEYVTGDIIMEVDSDDYLTDNILTTVVKDYEALDDTVVGVIYQRNIDKDYFPLIKKIPNKTESLFRLHNYYGLDCDMSLTFKSIYRKGFKYEVEKGEKFVSEAGMYYKIELGSDGFYLNSSKKLIESKYQEDGYTKNILKVMKNNPKGYYQFFKECLSYDMNDVTFKRKIYFIKHYILFSYLTNTSFKSSLKSLGSNKLLFILLYIPGIIVSKRRFK